MSLSYAQEKAYLVLHALAEAGGDLRFRLLAAMIPSFMSLRDEAMRRTGGLDERLAADIESLYERLSCIADDSPGKARGTIQATLDSLDEHELTQAADRMVKFCVEVMQTVGAQTFDLPSLRN